MDFIISTSSRKPSVRPEFKTLSEAIDAAKRKEETWFVFHVLWDEPKAIVVRGEVFRSVEWCVEEACRSASVAIRGTLR